MDREEAAAVAEGVIARLRKMGYDALVERLLDEIEVEEVVGPSGVTYQVEVEGLSNAGKPGDLMVLVAVDDGGLRSSFSPVNRSFIVSREGSSTGE